MGAWGSGKQLLWKRTIERMLELAKRWGPYFLGAFVASLGLSLQAYIFLDGKCYQFTLIATFMVIAVLCLAMAAIAFVYDFREARRKDYEQKHPGKHINW